MKFYTNVVAWGNSILIRGYGQNGTFKEKVKYLPTLFVRSKNGNSQYKLFNSNLAVDAINPGSIKDTKDFVERYKDVEAFPIYGQTNYSFQYISDNYSGEIKYDSKRIRVHFIDIEVEAEAGFPKIENVAERINLITIYDSINDHTVTFGYGEYESKIKDQKYVKCRDETDMLVKYIEFHCMNYPDVITGWYSNGFDIPYMCRRIEKLLGANTLNRLSPWGNVFNKERVYNGETEYSSSILGISLIDYLDLYKKFILSPRESYKLDFIAETELGENKVSYDCSFKDFYQNQFKTFVEYNIQDTLLVYRLERKLKLLDILFTISYIAKVNYEDAFSPVISWDTYIYNYLKEQNIVIPEQKYSRRGEYPGGFVKEPVKGLHEWIVSFDIQSSYPHQIMQYSISPENFIDEKVDIKLEDLINKKADLSFLKERNLTMTANGWLYKREKGLFPVLAERMFNIRIDAKKEMKEYKKQLIELKEESKKNGLIDQELLKKVEQVEDKVSSLDNLQMAMKILINSLYGAVGSPYFRYYDMRMAEGITLSGQLAVLWMERKFNLLLNKIFETTNVDYIVAIDTDSNYLILKTFIDNYSKSSDINKNIDLIDRFCKEVLSPYVEKSFKELATYTNAYEQKMVMGRDTISSKGIFCAKKKYVLKEHDSEGVRYSEPKTKIVGLQIIQSSTPKVMKEKLSESLNLIMNSSEEKLQEYVLQLDKSFSDYAVEEISKPTSVDNIQKYSDNKILYTKGTPIHVRGSILYNEMVKKLKMENDLPLIKDGDKIKFTYLKVPNPLKEDVIAFPSELPKEFELHKYVDYETQFKKVYLSALNTILDVIDWTAYKSNSMSDLFE